MFNGVVFIVAYTFLFLAAFAAAHTAAASVYFTIEKQSDLAPSLSHTQQGMHYSTSYTLK